MKLLQIIVFPLTIIIHTARFLYRHPKSLILVAVLFFVVVGVATCNRQFSAGESPATAEALTPQDYQINAPSTSIAPQVVATPSRIYFVAEYTDDGEVVTLSDYYSYENGKWERKTQPLTLDRNYYGGIKIYER